MVEASLDSMWKGREPLGGSDPGPRAYYYRRVRIGFGWWEDVDG